MTAEDLQQITAIVDAAERRTADNTMATIGAAENRIVTAIAVAMHAEISAAEERAQEFAPAVCRRDARRRSTP